MLRDYVLQSDRLQSPVSLLHSYSPHLPVPCVSESFWNRELVRRGTGMTLVWVEGEEWEM